MSLPKAVLAIGIDPNLIDFSGPEFAAFPGMNAEKVFAGLRQSEAALRQAGYDAEFCLIDFGATAKEVVASRLKARPWDVVLIGAGVRVPPSNFLLFEQLINVIHEHAPQAKICFNTHPGDTAEAVQRWA